MNPFEDNNDNNLTQTKEINVNIWVETNGRKKNTYVSGWTIPEAQLKEHLKNIKKKNGCNGCIKEIPDESNDELINVVQLQGDHTDYLNQYLIANGVDKSKIKIKG